MASTPSIPTSRSTRPRRFQLAAGSPKGIEASDGIIPIQPFETPYSWAVDVDVDDDTVQRVRELYAAEITYLDEWIGRLMNKMADAKLLDETVVVYMSDHGLTLGEHGILGKHAARAQWHIYHVPGDDPASRGQARRRDRATTSPPPTTCRARCSR